MKYALLYYDVEEATQEPTEAEIGAWVNYAGELEAAGAFRSGEALQESATATVLRSDGGTLRTTDGPFAETKEQLGGFDVIEAANLDEAIALASKVPSLASGGTVEIRPVFDVEMT